MTTYAYMTTDSIQSEGGLPRSARRLDTQQWVLGLATAPAALQQACGWYAVTDTPRPADTDTHTHDRTLALAGDVPTVAWVQRAKTADEIAADTAQANRATIEARAATIITQMDAIVASTGTLTAAQLSGGLRQVAAGLRGLVRVTMNKLDKAD